MEQKPYQLTPSVIALQRGNALHGPRKMVIGFGMYVNYNNREVNLRNLAEAQRGNIENVYDKMWKILDMFSQKIEITV
jgi:hypothetical protein